MTTADGQDVVRNGVDTATLSATVDAVTQAPDVARFQFRARNRWLSGTHSRSTISDFHGVGEEREHEVTFVFDADHPAVLVGKDDGPTPVEYLLHALAACLTAGMAAVAAVRGITLHEVRSTVSGDIDLSGALGSQQGVRNGFERIDVHVEVSGDGTPEQMRALVEESRNRSPVHDVITDRVPVDIRIDVA